MIQNILADRSTRLFIILSGLFLTCALLAEIIGVKIFSMEDTLGINRLDLKIFGGSFSFHLTAGVLLWPVVFVMTDIINEYYGPRGVKFLSYLAIVFISFSFVIFKLAMGLKPSEFFSIGNGISDPDSAFRGIFGQGSWIIIGSLVAFFIGQLLDVSIFHRIKKTTGEKNIWLRATGSTLVSQLIDSFIVLFIAFYIGRKISPGQGEAWTLQQVVVTGTGNYIYKFIVAILLTPVIYFVHHLIDKYLGDKAALLKRSAMGIQSQ